MSFKRIAPGVFFFSLLLYAGSDSASLRAEDVSLSYTATTLTFLPGSVALDQGFFRQAGLEVEFIPLRSAALVPALANGHIDYTMSFLPPIDSALRGVLIQMLAVFVDRSLHYLVAKGAIRSSAELRGKTFALNTVECPGSALNCSTRSIPKITLRRWLSRDGWRLRRILSLRVLSDAAEE